MIVYAYFNCPSHINILRTPFLYFFFERSLIENMQRTAYHLLFNAHFSINLNVNKRSTDLIRRLSRSLCMKAALQMNFGEIQMATHNDKHRTITALQLKPGDLQVSKLLDFSL